ncbi:50S ribosomal protein L6 [Blochmannia endosymbiont of Colobopsis nipponica]|uniref:50S ribosomal protein L6 n=1 Tax=Blochmannia endosymbiont of Colobopsis nipponica TaxID=2681987 RepID=UPI00177F5C4F|nr:50S ribosomal protein L6 [Blochmannia endosymbiont of Colobopsis nipponica]QOI11210.1 50S ribosomal protein L6 [Blochmannia endosymbiont of Colobopsis nipponica]
MSRATKLLVLIPEGVITKINGKSIKVCGNYGELSQIMHDYVNVHRCDKSLILSTYCNQAKYRALAGTMCSLLRNMMIGVSQQFIKRLQLVGIGYRVIINDKVIILSVGFSHSINYELPAGISVECSGQTEIILKGIDKQLVGQVSADLRSLRPPEPFKGKGIRYVDEFVYIKETKKR